MSSGDIPLLVESSIKRALDIDWNDAIEKTEAITTFSRQLDALQSWIARQLLEPDPLGGGVRIR